jgi:hypothetical protein|tara:strand:- start:1295 stop:1642 length:348 start_codon:yes stop_codon:yes gene_type:complete
MKRSVNEYDENRGGGLGTMLGMKGAVAGTAVGTNYLMDRKADKDAQAKREAEAEIKRESRGVKKPANFDAIEESKQDAKDAAARKKISDMGYKNGGYVRAADGIAKRGKTRGKMC